MLYLTVKYCTALYSTVPYHTIYIYTKVEYNRQSTVHLYCSTYSTVPITYRSLTHRQRYLKQLSNFDMNLFIIHMWQQQKRMTLSSHDQNI